MRQYVNLNKKWWNKVTPIHSSSKLYDLENFKKGKISLEEIEREEIGLVKGKDLLHLMCHFGLDTLSWARMGANVTGVDFSKESIKLARKISREINTPARFITSDIYNLPSVLNMKFDIIFTSYGVLCWLSDISKWAKIINRFLKRGGVFYIVELHPFTNIFSSDCKVCYKYFDRGPDTDDSSGTYADWNANINSSTYIWSYTISDVVNALIKEELKIEFIHEFPYTMYEQFPGLMRQNRKKQYVLKNKRIQIPLLFSLKATK